MSPGLLARAAQFQAAWFFGLILLVILGLIVIAAAFVFAGVRRLWRAGEHGPAAIVGGVTVLGLCVFVGMFGTALGGLLVTGGAG